VYVGCDDNNVYALNADTGRLRWRYATGNTVHSSPAVAYGTVYVGSQDGKLYAIYADTGKLRWSDAIGGNVWSSPAVVHDTVYIGSWDNETVDAFKARP
jgi:outer membrane protein assembly factor BamB